MHYLESFINIQTCKVLIDTRSLYHEEKVSYHIAGTEGSNNLILTSLCNMGSNVIKPSVPSDMYTKRRLNQTAHPRSLIWVFVFCIKKVCINGYRKYTQWILIRLHECTDCSESLLGAYVRKYVLWRSGSYILHVSPSYIVKTNESRGLQ